MVFLPPEVIEISSVLGSALGIILAAFKINDYFKNKPIISLELIEARHFVWDKNDYDDRSGTYFTIIVNLFNKGRKITKIKKAILEYDTTKLEDSGDLESELRPDVHEKVTFSFHTSESLKNNQECKLIVIDSRNEEKHIIFVSEKRETG